MPHSLQNLPPIEGLAAVIEAHRGGSFSAAAAALEVTHGAISRRVQAVEHWLGTPLFERHGRGVRPTPAGQRFIAEIGQALSSIRDSADRWRPRQELPVVRISVVPSFARLWLLPRLPQLQGVPPRVRIELLLDHRVAELGEGGADLAVRYGRGRWPGVDATLLFGERLFPVAAPALARRLGTQVSAAQLARESLLHDSDTSQWRAWLAHAGLRYRTKSADRRFEDYDLVLAAAEAGLGVALLRFPLADDRVRAGALVRVSPLAIPNAAGHYLAARRDQPSPAQQTVAEELIALTAHLRAPP
jgi:LysR family transcriptional regulator, glycine cleavage system transcriptional activator